MSAVFVITLQLVLIAIMMILINSDDNFGGHA